MNVLVHALDGRLRIRIPGIKRNVTAAASVERALLDVKGIKAVKANPLTGSVLISYDPWRIGQSDLLDFFGVAMDADSGAAPQRSDVALARRMTEVLLPICLEAICYYAFRRLLALPLGAL